jgi:hypothetical protein
MRRPIRTKRYPRYGVDIVDFLDPDEEGWLDDPQGLMEDSVFEKLLELEAEEGRYWEPYKRIIDRKRYGGLYKGMDRKEIIKKNRIWQKQKYDTDPMFRLNNCVSSSIRHSLRGKKRRRHWETLVGYTLQELKEHLEQQFQPGMTWKNYGKWHIDHIIPLSWWEFEKPEDREFKQAWALCNLRPLWAAENIQKSNRPATVSLNCSNYSKKVLEGLSSNCRYTTVSNNCPLRDSC